MKSLKIIFAVVTSLFLCIQMNAQQRRPDLEKQYKEQIKELKNNLKGEMKIESVEIEEVMPGHNYIVVREKGKDHKKFYDFSLNPLFSGYNFWDADTFDIVTLSNGKEYIRISNKGIRYASLDAQRVLTSLHSNVTLIEVKHGDRSLCCLCLYSVMPTA